MEIIRNWCGFKIRQNEDGYFSASDITRACGIENYSLDDWTELMKESREIEDDSTYPLGVYVDKENDEWVCWVCPSLAQELAKKIKDLHLQQLLIHLRIRFHGKRNLTIPWNRLILIMRKPRIY
jgi:hypothetical protein